MYHQCTKRIHELKGENFYLSNDLLNAYQEFNKAGGKYALEKDNQSKFDKCQEYWDYNNLTSYSSEEKLFTFLKNTHQGSIPMKYQTELLSRKQNRLLCILVLLVLMRLLDMRKMKTLAIK